MVVPRPIRPERPRGSELEVFETILYDRLSGKRVRCTTCQRKYLGNVHGHPAENTYCPRCGNLLIRRGGFSILRNDIVDGRCIHCGSPIWGTFDS